MVLRSTISYGLSISDAENVVNEICHAARQGFRPSTFITIHLERAGQRNAYPLVSRFDKHRVDWLRHRSTHSHFVRVLENPTNPETGLSGLHCYELEYMPSEHFPEYCRRAPHWINLAGGTCMPKVFHTRQLPSGSPPGTLLCDVPPLFETDVLPAQRDWMRLGGCDAVGYTSPGTGPREPSTPIADPDDQSSQGCRCAPRFAKQATWGRYLPARFLDLYHEEIPKLAAVTAEMASQGPMLAGHIPAHRPEFRHPRNAGVVN